MLNGLLGIVIYRLTHFCRPTWVMTVDQRRRLNYIILVLTLGSSIGLTASAFYHIEHYDNYQMCLGKITIERVWDLPRFHPFLLVLKGVPISRIIFVPVGYIIIFFFRKKMDKKAPGISENSRRKRLTRNVGNAKFNFYIEALIMSKHDSVC